MERGCGSKDISGNTYCAMYRLTWNLIWHDFKLRMISLIYKIRIYFCKKVIIMKSNNNVQPGDDSRNIDDSFIAPAATSSELKIRKQLHERKIPFETGKIIWYSLTEKYTPDLIIGGNLICEVDGSVHSLPEKKVTDRIRQRALEAMGYYVIRVKNYEIANNPEAVAERIIQKFYEVTGIKNDVKILSIKPYTKYNFKLTKTDRAEIMKFLSDKSILDLSDEMLLSEMAALKKEIFESPKAIEILLLQAYGLSLRKTENGEVLDYAKASRNFAKVMRIFHALFGHNGDIGIKNNFLISAPNFMKNVVIDGGPKINQGLINITNYNQFKANIESYFPHF